MSMKHNRMKLTNRSAGLRRPRTKGGKAPPLAPPVVTESDVRPDRVAKARELISREAYPPSKVVESLAEQIARFF